MTPPLPYVAHILYDHTIVLQARHTFRLKTIFNMVSESLFQVVRGGCKMKPDHEGPRVDSKLGKELIPAML